MRFARTRHALWAGAIALVLSLLTLLNPIDNILWALQSRMYAEPASGEIVYIGSSNDLADPAFPERRRQLADVIGRLDRAGAGRVYVNVVFDRPSEPAIDGALNRQMRALGGRGHLVAEVQTASNGENRLQTSVPAIARGVPQVGIDSWQNFMGYVWSQPFEVVLDGTTLPSLSSSIARKTGPAGKAFPISYNFDSASIPMLEMADLADNTTALDGLAGKTVVIGHRPDRASVNIPGRVDVPPTLVEIYAAETLLAGKTRMVPDLAAVLATLALLIGATVLPRRRTRRPAYALIVVALPAATLVTALAGIRMNVADAIVLLIVYAVYRWRSRWVHKLRLVDAETGLPTFLALEGDKSVSELVPAIIVAKIHRFEEVRRTLPRDLHAEYVLRITGRLKAATQDAVIYLGSGHMIAWTMAEKDPALLREHLEGLRALFSSPLLVGEQQVDVGITFGVDLTPSPNAARRLASATAAAERTTETFDPIVMADTASQEDLNWSISLQARIDAALANHEIFLAFQPKVLVQSGEIVGVEALVRWNDPEKGAIPPDNFIRQCETTGRMSQLTRYVLEQACRAGNAFEDAGLNVPIAVNISATLVHERSIVTMVSEVLDQTGFEPRRLTLEITETYRISNLDTACEVLRALESLGCKISMDDFGVGAASLEALLRLPFHELKIDRVFTSQITTSAKALAIVKSILDLGKTMRIIVVAEGVEDLGTLTLLRESGCIVGQGYAISRPVSLEKIVQIYGDRAMPGLRNMV